MKLEHIIEPIRSDLEEFEKGFLKSLDSDVNLINAVIRYVAAHRGKRLRPALVFLVARLLGHIDRQAIEAAQIVELIHTATLIHDDVVDEADMRRGAASVNQVWNNKIAVLVGDFLFAQVLNKMFEIGNQDINRIIARVTTQMSEGELLQIQQSRDLQLDEASYFRMITDKTASLISAACQMGAIIGNRYNAAQTERFWDFGTYLGCAFQIQDDLLDFIGDERITGKPVGNDVKENKITLPLIYAIHRNGSFPVEHLKKLLAQEKTADVVSEIRELVLDSGGVEYAQNRANEFVEKALQILAPFEDSPYKRSLEELVEFAAVRSN